MSDLVPVRNPVNDSIAFVGEEYADHLVAEHEPAWEHVDPEVAEAETVAVLEPPSKNASKGDWVEWATTQGADRAEAEQSTRDELAEIYG